MAEVAVSIAAPVLGEGVKVLSTFGIRETFALSQSLDETYERLIGDLEWLKQVEKDIETEVQRCEDKDTKGTYTLWKNNIAKVERKADELRSKYEGQKLPKWRLLKRSRLSEKMGNLHRLVRDLLDKGEKIDAFLIDKEPQCVLKEEVPEIMGYETLQNALENILDFIKDNNGKSKTIGVHGTKGVGKTTILKNLNNNAEVATLFDIVIFVGLSANQTQDELRQEIADRLLLKTEGIKNPKEVTGRISKKLENKRYLLILDGVVECINLRELGIPDSNDCGKVVMASHIHQVLKWENKVDRLINVEPLSHDEAWKMFKDIVGQEIIGLRDIKPIARLVCKSCSCLPLLIQQIAIYFKRKTNARSWKAGLRALKPWPEQGTEGVQELYKCFKVRFQELKDEKKQKCFLYSSIYPADSNIHKDYLVECWAAQGLLGDVNDTSYHNVCDKGHEIVDDLVDMSLLEKGERKIYVKMLDCIRQLALYISSKTPNCGIYVVTNESSEQPYNSRTMQNLSWVSMIDSKRPDLPNGLNTNMLSTLLLQKNTELAIHRRFFENMSNLLVLDLYGTRIKELPSSLSTLIALKGLYLNDCMLLTLLPPEIGSLQYLQVLDIRGSGIPFIPVHIRSLAILKCLRISYVTGAGYCGDHVISELHKLEELIINVVSYQEWRKDVEHVMQHVASLENLSTLRCSFPSSNMLEEFLHRSKSWQDDKPFSSFQFFVGCECSKPHPVLESFEYQLNKYLKYSYGDSNDDFTSSSALAHTEAFELIGHKYIRNLSDFAGTSSLKDINSFLIVGCNKMSSILAGDTTGNGNISENKSILPNLQHLYLDTLLNLKHVFRGPLYAGTLSKLQVLMLKNCPSLKAIFFRVPPTDFPELQMLIIENCSEIEALLRFKEVTEREQNVLPKLERLVLKNLPIFSSICSNETLAWPSLELLEIYECPMLKSLPFGMDNAANLISIKGKKEWWDNLEWTNNRAQERLQKKFKAS